MCGNMWQCIAKRLYSVLGYQTPYENGLKNCPESLDH